MDWNVCYNCGFECNASSQICGRCARSSNIKNLYTIKDAWFNYIMMLNSFCECCISIKNNELHLEFVKNTINDLVNNNITTHNFYKKLYENNYISYMSISPEYRWNFDF